MVPITGKKAFSLNACAADQFYFTTLVWTREIFPVKQIAQVAIAKTYTWMKARDVKKENQMKSKLLRGSFLSRGKMKSVNISIKYSSVAVTKFVCEEIWLKNHFTLLQEKESKLLYSRYSFFIPFNEQQKCHVTNIYTERKNKYHITLFCKKRKVSYYITFFQTLLRTFSCGLCYSG